MDYYDKNTLLEIVVKSTDTYLQTTAYLGLIDSLTSDIEKYNVNHINTALNALSEIESGIELYDDVERDIFYQELDEITVVDNIIDEDYEIQNSSKKIALKNSTTEAGKLLTEVKYKNIKELIAGYLNLPTIDIGEADIRGLLIFATAYAILRQHQVLTNCKLGQLSYVVSYIDETEDIYRDRVNDITEIPTNFNPPQNTAE